jgi:hypothetical protein
MHNNFPFFVSTSAIEAPLLIKKTYGEQETYYHFLDKNLASYKMNEPIIKTVQIFRIL